MKPIDHLKALRLAKTKAQYPNVPEYGLPKFEYNPTSANGLTKCICDFITFMGYQAERINTAGRVIDNRKTYTDVIGRTKTIGSTKYIPTTGTKGSADISATIAGKSVKIEVKIGKDRQSEHQKVYQDQIENARGYYFIAKDFDSFYNWFSNFIKQNS
jgi:hypothetical protein